MGDNGNKTILHELLKTATPDTLKAILQQSFANKFEDSIDLLNDLISLGLSREQFVAIVDVVEKEYLLSCNLALAPILSKLYNLIGNQSFSLYYQSLAGDLEIPKVKTQINSQIKNSQLKRKYAYKGEIKEYSIFSFSQEIGKNLTLLKTPYGTIIFDCGAKCGLDEADLITEQELKDFLVAINVDVVDIKAVVISHAHLDHYGSISTLLNIGISPSTIFMSKRNRELISCVAHNIPRLCDFLPVSAFFSPNKCIEIKPFPNGHILGSEGYVVYYAAAFHYAYGGSCKKLRSGA